MKTIFKKNAKLIAAATAAFAFGISSASAQTTLSVGDIQVTGVTSDANDSFTFVLWKDIAANTVIRFMDQSFTNNTNALLGTESDMSLTFLSGLSAGSVIRVENNGTTIINGVGATGVNLTQSGSLSGISNSGDQVFAYQGTAVGNNGTDFTGRTLLYGLNIAGSSWISTGTADPNKSYLPTAINTTDANLDTGNFNNADYTGTRFGLTATAYKAAINSLTNYTQSNTRTDLVTTTFTIATSASLYWDANGATANDGGAGTWDSTTADRFKNGAAGTTFLRWVNSSTGNDHTAVFGGTAGTVTVSGGVTASGLQFDTTAYTVTGSTIALSGSATPTIATGSLAATINSALAGTQGFTKTGTGTLTLGGSSTGLSGGVTHSAGILDITNGAALGTGTLTFNGYNKLQINVADGASMTVANNIVLPSTGTGGESELIRVGDATPTAGTTARLTGIISGGASGQTYTLVDSDQTSNHNESLVLDNSANSFQGIVELYRGVLGFTSDGALGNVNNTLKVNLANNNGGLRFDANNITLAATRTIQLVAGEVINTQANNGTIAGALSGSGTLFKNGSGKLTLSAANAINTLTGATVNQGTLAIATNTLASTRVVTINSGATLEATGRLNLNANGSSTFDVVTGAGTLNLRSTTSSATNPDISFNDNSVANSTANYGTAINSAVDLGSSQRFIWGKTNHNSVSKYLLSSGADANFKGVISGTGGLTFAAQHNYTGTDPMEVPFVLSGANTFTGMVEIQRGSVYLNNANALNQGNVLSLAPAAGNNARFFLYGRNASVSNLQSSGAGTSLIANGNAANPTAGVGGAVAATLTVTQNADTTYAGTIVNGQAEYDSGSVAAGALSLLKAGSASLTLSGVNTYTGGTSVTAGRLVVNGGVAGSSSGTGTGAVTVTTSGTLLGGNGNISGTVSMAAGTILAAGTTASAGSVGTLRTGALTLANTTAINFDLTTVGVAGGATNDLVGVTGNLTLDGLLTVNGLSGFGAGRYTLFTYTGALTNNTLDISSIPSGFTSTLDTGTTGFVYLDVVSAVPEPSTWIGGGLLLGLAAWRMRMLARRA